MNIDQLKEIQKEVLAKKSSCKRRVGVCHGAGCISSGSHQVLEGLQKSVMNAGLSAEVDVFSTGCMGACSQGPLVQIQPDDTLYEKVTPQDFKAPQEHALKGTVMPGKILFPGAYAGNSLKAADNRFYQKQLRIVLENCGKIDPESIEDYIAAGGYQALHRAVVLMSPEQVIGEVKQSGLRGRGGAGYPTGLKWELVYKSVSDVKYVVCNADEGDPGAFMDRCVLEGDPHRVLEGMAIAGYAVGAQKGYIYVRGEYPLAIHRLEIAIRQARDMGILQKPMANTNFTFDIEIRIGAGAYVCGEETALLASIEGKRGTPRPRPPYPPESGLWGKPTLINNVETFANIAPIVVRWPDGGEWFSKIGTPKSTGTKVFALSGAIANTGVVEVPMGITLREIIFEIGGGIPGGKKFKAAQTGGPSGGCIPEEFLDTKIEYETLTALGSMMGSGGLIVLDESSCMVDLARYFMEFCMDESCGKCVPCRVGTRQMYDLLTKICSGQARRFDLEVLEDLAHTVKDASLCGLGMAAPNPLLSTLRYFRNEYLAHIDEGRCPAGACRMSGSARMSSVGEVR